jgi:hypothetical protein
MCFVIQVFPKAFLRGDIWDEDVGLTGTKRESVMGGA